VVNEELNASFQSRAKKMDEKLTDLLLSLFAAARWHD
jgi:hypothetical protein